MTDRDRPRTDGGTLAAGGVRTHGQGDTGTDSEATAGGDTLDAGEGTLFAHGALAGVAAGVVFGAVLGAFGLLAVVATLYVGHPDVAVGWAAHLVHAGVLGGFFAALGVYPRIGRWVRRFPHAPVAGLAYAGLLGLVNVLVLRPVWLRVAGVAAPPIPDVDPAFLLAHLAWGLVLGLTVPVTEWIHYETTLPEHDAA